MTLRPFDKLKTMHAQDGIQDDPSTGSGQAKEGLPCRSAPRYDGCFRNGITKFSLRKLIILPLRKNLGVGRN